MDNLTHSLVGLTLAKAGLEKLSPGTTALCILAANAPDADIFALFGGRWFYVQNHRGITHSIVGVLALAVFLPLIFYAIDWLIARFRKTAQLVRLKGLFLASLVATVTHPMLDWTNNYGVRLLLPWNSRWFYGDLVFIMDPFIWIILGGACFLVTSNSKSKKAIWIILALIPTLLVFFGPISRGGLANAFPLRVVWILAVVLLVFLYTRRFGKQWNQRIPQVALAIVVMYAGLLGVAHAFALKKLIAVSSQIITRSDEHPIAVAAMPTLANPARWLCVVKTNRYAYRFELTLTSDQPTRVTSYPNVEAFSSDAMLLAKRDSRAQVFLNFARFPVAQISGDDCVSRTLVQFADLRYTEPGTQGGVFSLEVPVDCSSSK